MRIPSGISSIMWCDVIEAWPCDHFTAGFFGAAPKQKDTWMESNGDPEDRIIVYREP